MGNKRCRSRKKKNRNGRILVEWMLKKKLGLLPVKLAEMNDSTGQILHSGIQAELVDCFPEESSQVGPALHEEEGGMRQARPVASPSDAVASQRSNRTAQKNIAQVTKVKNPNMEAKGCSLSTQQSAMQRSGVSNTKVEPQRTHVTMRRMAARGSNAVTLQGPKLQNTRGVNMSPSTPEPQIFNLTTANVAVHNNRLSFRNIPSDRSVLLPWNTAVQTPVLRPIEVPNFKQPAQRLTVIGAVSFTPDCFKHQHPKSPEESKLFTSAGSSKRSGDSLEEDGKKGRPRKRIKTLEDNESKSGNAEDSDWSQEPFEIIEIEEPRIKQEIFETEEFSEVKCEGDMPDKEKGQFEAVFCSPDIMKEELLDCVETPSGHITSQTDTLAPEFMYTEVKVEPPENGEEYNEEPVKETRDIPSQMWRCPLISCPETFSAELEMYQHLNLNHVVQGLALSSKSKKVVGPRSSGFLTTSVTKELPNKPSVVLPSSSPSVAISGSSGLVFFTSASSPHVCPAVSTPVPTSQPVPSSCSGPVIVTTTFSYSSLTTSSTSHVTAVSSSSFPSVSSTSLNLSVTPNTVLLSSADLNANRLASSPFLVPTTTSNCSPSPNNVATSHINSSASHPPKSLSVTALAPGTKKIIVAPISSQTPVSTGSKQFLLLSPQQNSLPKTTTTQLLHIFQPSEPTTENIPPCALDDSEMFSISLARFPENRRGPIKQKLMDVVDCLSLKNVSAEKLVIAYYGSSPGSRAM